PERTHLHRLVVGRLHLEDQAPSVIDRVVDHLLLEQFGWRALDAVGPVRSRRHDSLHHALGRDLAWRLALEIPPHAARAGARARAITLAAAILARRVRKSSRRPRLVLTEPVHRVCQSYR